MTAMTWLRGTGFRALVALMVALFGAPSFGQIAKAPGFKVGEGRLHPFFELDARFDSVVGQFVPNVNTPEIIFHFRPGLKFDLDTPSTGVNFAGAAEYLWYTGLLSPESVQLSQEGRGFRANVALDTRFNKDGVAEVQLGDNLVRSDRTNNPAVAFAVLSLFNNLYLAVPIHPGGRALEVTPKLAWSVEFFEPMLGGSRVGCTSAQFCDTTIAASMNYSNLNFGVNARWKFLPKTALIVDVGGDWRTYFSNPGLPSPTGMGGGLDKVLFRAQAGLAGLISPRIAVTLLAGYSGDFTALGTTPTTDDTHTFIGTAEFSYTVSEQSRIAVGYMRNYMAVPLIGTVIDDRGYLRGGLGLMGGRLQLNAQVSADYFTFIGVVRNDFLLSLMLGPTFTVTQWFDIGASYTLSARTSNAAGLNFPPLRHEAMLRLSFHY